MSLWGVFQVLVNSSQSSCHGWVHFAVEVGKFALAVTLLFFARSICSQHGLANEATEPSPWTGLRSRPPSHFIDSSSAKVGLLVKMANGFLRSSICQALQTILTKIQNLQSKRPGRGGDWRFLLSPQSTAPRVLHSHNASHQLL